MDKSGRDYFEDPVFRIASPDIIPSSEMQNHSMRTDTDLARFLPASREIFCRSRILFTGREFFTGRDFFRRSRIFWPVENSFCRSRILFFFCKSRNMLFNINICKTYTGQRPLRAIKQGKWRTFWVSFV